ncbi:MAG: DUF2971 domain-containing protein [Armatimonadetes bacterium]|nr:DUF2971 domain-containing protein [Armatimonadota bacterium]
MNTQTDLWKGFDHGERTSLAHYEDAFPDDENLPLWRYMSFPVFVDLCLRSSLFFPTPRSLADPLEGMYPAGNYRRHEEMEASLGPGEFIKSPDEYKELWGQAASICCWTTWPTENAGMWGLYSDLSTGVAIRTTVGLLTRSFSRDMRARVRAGLVSYIDYETSRLSTADQARPFFFKTPAYGHEREFRLYHSRLHTPESVPDGVEYLEDGVYIAVDLKILIDRIVCAPHSADWHRSMVEELLRKRDVMLAVRKSEIELAGWR